MFGVTSSKNMYEAECFNITVCVNFLQIHIRKTSKSLPHSGCQTRVYKRKTTGIEPRSPGKQHPEIVQSPHSQTSKTEGFYKPACLNTVL